MWLRSNGLDLSAVADLAMFGQPQYAHGGVKSDEELAAIDEAINQSPPQSFKTGTGAGFKVYFESEIGGVVVNLSSSALDKIGRIFDPGDFYLRDDGSFILNGEAERFVSGWFADVALARNYIGANPDNLEVLGRFEVEQLQTRTTIFYKDGGATRLERYSLQGVGRDANSLMARTPLNIDEAMSKSIMDDTNADGIISVREFFAANAPGDVSEVAQNDGKVEGLPNISDSSQIAPTDKEASDNELAELKRKQKERELKMLEALARLAQIAQTASEQGIQALSKDDLDDLSLLNITPQELEKNANDIAKTLHVSDEFASKMDDKKLRELQNAAALISAELLDKEHLFEKWV